MCDTKFRHFQVKVCDYCHTREKNKILEHGNFISLLRNHAFIDQLFQ